MLLTNSAKMQGRKPLQTLLPPHFFGLAQRNGSQAAPGGRGLCPASRQRKMIYSLSKPELGEFRLSP